MSDFTATAEAVLLAEDLLTAFANRDSDQVAALLVRSSENAHDVLMGAILIADQAAKDAAILRKKDPAAYRRGLTSWLLHIHATNGSDE